MNMERVLASFKAATDPDEEIDELHSLGRWTLPQEDRPDPRSPRIVTRAKDRAGRVLLNVNVLKFLSA